MKDRSIDFCHKIYEDIVALLQHSNAFEANTISLFVDKWGLLLFMCYYEQHIDSQQANALSYLEKFYEEINIATIDYSYGIGLSGPFWLLSHLNKYDYIDIDIHEIAPDFITNAITQSTEYLSGSNFDFLHGSAGICNLLLDFSNLSHVREHLSFWVKKLNTISVPSTHGISFPTFHHYEGVFTTVGFDAVGIAHGSCAYQILLLKLHKAGIEQEICAHLIEQSLSYFLSKKKKPKNELDSLFPEHFDGKSDYSAISWCYGDLGVGLAFWQCGKYFDNKAWQQTAIEIFTHNTARITCEAASVTDVCLCHGTAGNAAIYLRMWHETKEPSFLKCAEDWYLLTHDMLAFSENKAEAGVKVWKGPDQKWQYSWSLLNGSAGVGLALISQAVATPLLWDELLLIS